MGTRPQPPCRRRWRQIPTANPTCKGIIRHFTWMKENGAVFVGQDLRCRAEMMHTGTNGWLRGGGGPRGTRRTLRSVTEPYLYGRREVIHQIDEERTAGRGKMSAPRGTGQRMEGYNYWAGEGICLTVKTTRQTADIRAKNYLGQHGSRKESLLAQISRRMGTNA